MNNQAEHMKTSIKRLKSLENCFSKIIMIITVFFIISRTADSTISIGMRLIVYFKIDYSIEFKLLLNIFRQLTLFLCFIIYSFNALIYLYIDKKLLKTCKETLKQFKVNSFLKNKLIHSIISISNQK